MISLSAPQTSRNAVLIPEEGYCYDDCQKQIHAAEREMGALVTAVRSLYGGTEASRAAEDWLELADDIGATLVKRYPEWPDISLAVTIRLADRRVQALNQAVTGGSSAE